MQFEDSGAPPERVAWWRVDSYRYDRGVRVYVERLTVERETACGVWLGALPPYGRFVLRAARKRYACPTEVEAFESFVARKEKQIRILERQLEHARLALKEGQRLLREARGVSCAECRSPLPPEGEGGRYKEYGMWFCSPACADRHFDLPF